MKLTKTKHKEILLKAASKKQQVAYQGNPIHLMFIGRTDAEAETPVLWPPHAKS